MDRVQKLEEKVKALYEEENPDSAEWADWLFDNHVLVVADKATLLAKRFGAQVELSRVAALLHDIADTKMPRNDVHAQTSLQMARELMEEAEFTSDEIKLVVDDAIRFHSCHGEERPASKEGKILATADALAHFLTDFYVFAAWAFGKEMNLEELKAWVLEKIERDLYKKIFFDEVREEAKPDYELIKKLFSR